MSDNPRDAMGIKIESLQGQDEPENSDSSPEVYRNLSAV